MSKVGVETFAPIGLGTSFYIENNFEATGRFRIGFPKQTSNGETAFFIQPAIGLRYNLLPDYIRPQIFTEMTFYQYFLGTGLDHTSLFGVGGGGGLEIFFARDVSLSFLGTYHRLIIIGGDDGNSLDAVGRITVYF
jgi:hypothetical protein